MFSKVGVKVFLGYYWIKTFFWIFCFAKILRTRKKKLKFGQISTKPGQNISRLPFLHHKLHEFSFPCHSLVSSFFSTHRPVPTRCEYVTKNYWFSFTISCRSIFFKVCFWKVIQRQQVIFHICMYEFFPKLCIHLIKPGEQWITAQGTIVAVTLTSTYIYVFSNIEWPCMSRL